MPADSMFFTRLATVRDVLATETDPETALRTIRVELQDQDVQREFFKLLDGPQWIAPLRQAGVFGQPAAPEETEDGRMNFPNWPASSYLKRMAPLAPAEVAGALAGIRTLNPRVILDIIEAGCAMPSSEAARLVPAVVDSVHAGSAWMGPGDAAELCVHLARGSETRAALELATALFQPSFDADEKSARWHDRYWFEEGMKKVVPALAEADPAAWLEVLSNWLDAQIAASDEVEPDSNDDFSPWWRPAIEEHAQNLHHDLKSLLTGFLREACERAISSHQADLPDVLEVLAKHERTVFKRIQLYLIAQHGDEVPALARERMMDRSLFDNHRFKHEYAILMEKRFPLLDDSQRNQWLSWIDAGPDLEAWARDVRDELGEEPTEEARRNRTQYWQFEKLHWIRQYLTDERKRFYDEMHTSHGEPELADLNVRVSSGWGWGGSPFTVEELSALPFDEMVAKVIAWRAPEHRVEGPTVDGLLDAFGECIAAKTEEFSTQAEVLAGKPSRFVQRFVAKMTEAIQAGRDIDVKAVLKLCQAIGAEPGQDVAGDESRSGASEQEWQWARDEAARFVRSLVEARDDDTPRYALGPLRDTIWTIIDAVARDPARSNIVHDTSKDDPRAHDYLTLGINSPRGKALEAALEYARWIGAQIKIKRDGTEIVPQGFDTMPEVRDLLEWQVTVGNRTIEALAVIGSRLGLLYWIDKDWLGRTAPALFDLKGITRSPRAAEGWAAWNAFVVWVRPHIGFYEIFKPEFAFAVSQSSDVAADAQSHERPMDHLAEHLMVLYARGQLGLDDDDGLLRRFLSEAHPDTRRHAIGFIGQILDREKDLPQAVVERAQNIWDVYWSDRGNDDTSEKPEVATFGLWFSSGRCEPSWALARLDEFTKVAPIAEPDHAVVERLAELAATHVNQVVQILDRMVRGDREGWHVQMWLDSVRTILKVAMETGGDARRRAEQLIDHLGRRGYVGLGDLLQAHPS